jgi:hypothetical protein
MDYLQFSSPNYPARHVDVRDWLTLTSHVHHQRSRIHRYILNGHSRRQDDDVPQLGVRIVSEVFSAGRWYRSAIALRAAAAMLSER